MSLSLLVGPQLFAFAAGFEGVGVSAPGSFVAERRNAQTAKLFVGCLVGRPIL